MGKTADALGSRLAIPALQLPKVTERPQHSTKHESQGQLPGQCHDGELLRDNEVRTTLPEQVQGHESLQTGAGEIHRLLQQ